MRCKEIQELLKSDYLDGELRAGDMRLIQEHLEKCPHCKKLEEMLLAQRKLLQEAGHLEVPGRVWQNIRDQIVAERLQEKEGILGSLRQRVLQPRVVFSLATAFAVIILVVTLAVKKQAAVSTGNDEIIPGYNLNGATANYISDLGTSIEEYFL